jgi:uridylate kinase
LRYNIRDRIIFSAGCDIYNTRCGKESRITRRINMNTEPKYKRVLLKLSGEALSSQKGIIDQEFLSKISAVLKKCCDKGVRIGIIVGAGNIWRGRQGADMDAAKADHMGMLATAINAIALQDAFTRNDLDACVMTAVPMLAFAEPYSRAAALEHMEKGKIVIFGGGLGIPFLSTDTAAAIRAAEIGADTILMAKNIDAIYTADPLKDKSATPIDAISYQEILSRGLAAMDATATSFCMDKHIPLHVFGLADPENIYRAVMGEKLGTLVY